MYCKRCGMDSANTEICDWCKQPMLAEKPPPAAEPAPPEKPRPSVSRPQPQSTVSNGLRFAVSVAAGLGLGILSILIAYAVTGKAPESVYYLKLGHGGGLPQAVFAGVLFGLLLGVLLGGLLSLTHWGPFLGLVLGIILGYVSLSYPPYVGPLTGAVAGILIGLIGMWGYKKPVIV